MRMNTDFFLLQTKGAIQNESPVTLFQRSTILHLLHSALLLTSSGQIEVTKWAIGSNNKNHSKLRYKDNKEIYQTDWLPNY